MLLWLWGWLKCVFIDIICHCRLLIGYATGNERLRGALVQVTYDFMCVVSFNWVSLFQILDLKRVGPIYISVCVWMIDRLYSIYQNLVAYSRGIPREQETFPRFRGELFSKKVPMIQFFRFSPMNHSLGT